MIQRKILLVSLLLFFISQNTFLFSQEKPSLCFTFDDGSSKDILDYPYFEWNGLILNQLEDFGIQAAFFVCGSRVDNEEGKKVIESWDNAGHIIANHTYSHKNYNNPNYTFDQLKVDFLRCDSLINGYDNFQNYYRAPYLKYGDTEVKRDSLNSLLKRMNYKNGYVTIDASDWFYNSKLIEFMEEYPGENIDGYQNAYIEHLLDRAKFYDELATELLDRKIKHNILLHHNLTSALFLGDLILAFKNEGWEIINADDAFTDSVYQIIPDIVPAGESIIWGIAKESGNYEDVLRYPGEDSEYEEEKLNKLESE